MKRAVILIIVLFLLVIQFLTATAQSSAPEATATMEAIRATEAVQSAPVIQEELPANDPTLLLKLLIGGLVFIGWMVMVLTRPEFASGLYQERRPEPPADHLISTEDEAGVKKRCG